MSLTVAVSWGSSRNSDSSTCRPGKCLQGRLPVVAQDYFDGCIIASHGSLRIFSGYHIPGGEPTPKANNGAGDVVVLDENVAAVQSFPFNHFGPGPLWVIFTHFGLEPFWVKASGRGDVAA